MKTDKLNIQIARLLNESNEFKCGFTAVGDSIYAMLTDWDGTIHPTEINPALWLESIKGERYEDDTTD